MSRPANPSYVVPVWAPNVNYPAGANPWSGTPTKTTHPAAGTVGITPRQGVAAQVFNRVVNDAYAVDQSTRDSLTALYNYVGQLPALNFVAGQSLSLLNSAGFEPVSRRWFLTGDNESVWVTADLGQTAMSPLSTVQTAGAGEACHGIDFDTSGNSVIATTTEFVFELNAGLSCTKPSAAGASLAGSTPCSVSFDPVNNRWCWVGSTGVAAQPLLFRTSTNRTAWAAATTGPGTGFVTAVVNRQLVCRKATGVTVFVGNNGATGKVATSSNGGTVWTAQSDITFAFTPTTLHLSFDDTSNTWLLVAGRSNAGVPQSELWTSSNDGVSWTRLITLNQTRLYRVATLGTLWVAGIENGPSGNVWNDVAFSLDAGNTWQACGLSPTGQVIGAFAGGSGVCMVGRLAAYWSPRIGRPLVNLT